MTKVAVLLFADSEDHADMGRAANALEIVKEFKEAGEEAKLIFDGAGTTWVPKLADENHDLHPLYKAVEDNIEGACSFCAKAFHVLDGVKESNVKLLDDYDGHPSVKNLVDDGYRIITI